MHLKCPKHPTVKTFFNDVKDHVMIIHKDDGVYRHIRFQAPGTSNQYFDLVTWPGILTITGDMGTFVFTRVEDMFTFFRMKEGEESLLINPGYWHEKLIGENTPGFTSRQWSPEAFRDAVKSDFRYYFKDSDYSIKVKRRCWLDIKRSVLKHSENEFEAMQAIHNFEHELQEDTWARSSIIEQIKEDIAGHYHPPKIFYFQDFWEHTLETYTYHFIWCLYAIVWGIKRYDLSGS